MHLSEEVKYVFRQLAALDCAGVPDSDVLAVLGCDESTVRAYREHEAYADFLQERKAHLVNTGIGINTTWDEIENASLKVISENLKYSKDGQFALSVARAANAAKRRNPVQREDFSRPVVDAHQGGATVFVNLNQMFVNQIDPANGDANMSTGSTGSAGNTVNGEASEIAETSIPQRAEQLSQHTEQNPKEIDFLPPDRVEKLIGKPKEVDQLGLPDLQEIMVGV